MAEIIDHWPLFIGHTQFNIRTWPIIADCHFILGARSVEISNICTKPIRHPVALDGIVT